MTTVISGLSMRPCCCCPAIARATRGVRPPDRPVRQAKWTTGVPRGPGRHPGRRRRLRTRHCLAAWPQRTPATPKQFWSLTEQGALAYRAGRFQEAVSLFEQSLKADSPPGRAVVNWAWLALASQRLGKAEEARRWLGQGPDVARSVR